MSNKGFSLNFDGFLDLAEDLDKALGTPALLEATKDALTKTKDYVNGEIEKAMASSRYNFTKGQGYSQGDIKRSFETVRNMPVEVDGTIVTAYAGVDLSEQAEETLYLIYGAPHTPKDTNLYNAIKVKGKIKKEVERIQKEVFTNAISSNLGGGHNG